MRPHGPRQDPPRDLQKSLRIFLPLAAPSRYPSAWKMAKLGTEPAPERRNPTGKNRVWDFFRLSNETRPANRRQPSQPRRETGPTPTKSASGIPYWPSGDPIGENGGENLYGFVGNDGNNWIDYLGNDKIPNKRERDAAVREKESDERRRPPIIETYNEAAPENRSSS